MYDKRDHFGFNVINFPCIKYSNIPSNPLSQLLLIRRICTEYNDFCAAMLKLTQEFLNMGFDKFELANKLTRFVSNY